MFMCRSLEEFRAAFLRIADEPPPPPQDVGPTFKVEPDSSDENGDEDPQPKRYRLVVKREAY